MTREQAFEQVVTVTLKPLWCSECSVAFAISANFMQRRRDDHATFYCPNGHRQHYPHANTEELAKRRAANAEENARILRIELESERRSSAAYKGHLTRMRRRIANGVCPCCTRSFSNVRRHMATQHPDVLAKLDEAT